MLCPPITVAMAPIRTISWVRNEEPGEMNPLAILLEIEPVPLSMFQVWDDWVGLCLKPPTSSPQTTAVTRRAYSREDDYLVGQNLLAFLRQRNKESRINAFVEQVTNLGEAKCVVIDD